MARTKGPPSPKLAIASEHDVDDLDAEALLSKVQTYAHEFQKERGPIAQRNERWYHGDQWHDAELVDEDTWGGEWDDNLPRIEDNLLPNAVDTACSRLLEMQPVTVWFPRSGSGGSPIVAAVCNRVAEHYNQVLFRQQKLRRCCQLAFFGGSGALKIYWNPYKGVFTEATDPEGDLSLDVLSILDYATDGAEHVQDARWLYHTRLVDKHEGFAMLRAAGYSKQDAKQIAFEAAADESSRYGTEDAPLMTPVGWSSLFAGRGYVRASEIWWLPGAMIPEGSFTSFVGSKVVENMEYPYDHDELPLAVVKWREVSGSPHGSTPMDSMVKIQRMRNEILSIRTKRIWEFRNNWVVGPSKLLNQMRNNAMISTDGLDNPGKPEVVTVEPNLTQFDKLLEDTAAAMDNAAGIPALLSTGAGFATTTVGKSMGYMNYLVQLKSMGTLWSVFTAVARIDRQILELVQQHFTLDRMVRLLGPGSELAAQLFLEADLDGYVVLPQPGHGDMLSRIARASEAKASVAEGTMDPQRGAEIGSTGLTETEDETWHVQQVHEAARKVLEGGDAVVPDDVDAAVAVRELRRLVDSFPDAQGADGLLLMLQHFEGELAAPPAAAPMPEQQVPIEEVFQ